MSVARQPMVLRRLEIPPFLGTPAFPFRVVTSLPAAQTSLSPPTRTATPGPFWRSRGRLPSRACGRASPIGRLPQLLGGHRLDQFLGRHRRLGVGQDLDGDWVLARLAFAGGLLGSCSVGRLLCSLGHILLPARVHPRRGPRGDGTSVTSLGRETANGICLSIRQLCGREHKMSPCVA
jgi:hypothetical protein